MKTIRKNAKRKIDKIIRDTVSMKSYDLYGGFKGVFLTPSEMTRYKEKLPAEIKSAQYLEDCENGTYVVKLHGNSWVELSTV